MKKNLLIALLLSFAFNSYSQIRFESGYFINEANQKISCLIKNSDWADNPSEFFYKTGVDEPIQKGEIKSVKAFEVYNAPKYVRETVQIDRSNNNLAELSTERNPSFQQDTLFLKVLVEGKASLYMYTNDNLLRFFYKTSDSSIRQLVFKVYSTVDNKIAENNTFRQQLFMELKCSNNAVNTVSFLRYAKADLEKFFIEYNKCVDPGFSNYLVKKKKDLFNLTLRPGINFSSLAIHNTRDEELDADFGSKTGFIFGAEAEFILPFKKNTWSIILEPTVRSFNAERTYKVNFLAGLGTSTVTEKYTGIDLPLGLRHYFFLNTTSKVFLNASYSYNFSNNSSISYARSDGSVYNELDINPSGNFAFGGGFKYNDRFSVELRYQTSRSLLKTYSFWLADYNSFAVTLGYSLF